MKHSKRTSVLALLLAVLLVFSVAAPAALAADIPTPTGFSARYMTHEGEPCIFCSWDRLDYTNWGSYSGYSIVYSTDQENWAVADVSTDIFKIQTYITTFYEGGKPKQGTTYYLAMMYISADGESIGTPSEIVSVKFGNTPTATQPTTKPATQPTTKPATQPTTQPAKDSALQKEFDQLKKDIVAKPKITTKKFSGGLLQKGSQVIYTHPLYTITFLVTKLIDNESSYEINYKITISSKYGLKLNESRDWNRDSTLSKDQKTETGSFFIGTLRKSKIEFSLYLSDFSAWCKNRFENKVDNYSEIGNLIFYEMEDEFKIEYTGCKGLEPKIDKSAISADWKSITLNSKASMEYFDLYYRESGAKKWKKVSFKEAGKSLTAKNLQANTVYQVRIRTFRFGADQKKNYIVYSDIVKVRTGANAKPVVVSVKVSNVKKTTVHHNGHYTYYADRPAEWVPATDEKRTSYTVTVKIKSLPENAVGVYADDHAQKGTTISYTTSVAGHVSKVSGSVAVRTYMNSFGYGGGTGLSPITTVKYSN